MDSEQNPKVEFEESIGPVIGAVLGCVEPNLIQISALLLLGYVTLGYNNLNFII